MSRVLFRVNRSPSDKSDLVLEDGANYEVLYHKKENGMYYPVGHTIGKPHGEEEDLIVSVFYMNDRSTFELSKKENLVWSAGHEDGKINCIILEEQ